MMKRLARAFNSRIEGLHDAAYLLALFTLASHILALVRDRWLAHTFGASISLDVYYAAFRVPDFIFVSVASMASLFVLIPFLLEKGTDEAAQKFLSSVFSAFLWMILIVSAIIFIFTPQIVSRIFPGLIESGAGESLILLTRLMLVSPILLGVSNIFSAVVQISQRFLLYALSPVLYNVGLILGISVLFPLFGLPGLAYGVIVGALLHMAVQIPAVLNSGMMPRLKFRIDLKEIKSVVSTSLPRTLTLAINQLVMLILVGIASVLLEGSITIFNFAFNLQGVPMTLIGVSYSVAAFPTLARLFSKGDVSRFFDQMITAIRHILFWSFPAMVLFIVLRAQIVRSALGSGAFDWADTRLTAAVLALFVVSLVAQSLEMLFIRGYYAIGKTYKPLKIKLTTLLFSVGIAIVGVEVFQSVPEVRYFVEALLRITDVPGSTVVILALSYSVGIIVSAVLFWVLFRKDFGSQLPASLYRTLWDSFSSAVIGGGATYVSLIFLADVFNLNTFIGIFSQGLIAGLIGIAVSVAVLYLQQNRELEEIWETLHHRFWRTETVIPEQEEL